MNRIINKIIKLTIKARLRSIRRLSFGDSVTVKGMPLVETTNGGEIHIGSNCTLNSINAGYHVNMFQRVKLLADRPGAKIVIGDRSRIHGSCIHAYESISIGQRCLIAANCQIIDCNGHELSFDNVEIG